MSKLLHEETFCCGFKRCPSVRIYETGLVEVSDDDADKGSVGTIKLTRTQALLLAKRIEEVLKS